MAKKIKTVTLDFTGCKTYRDLHYCLRDTLNFPDYYGCNLSALSDSLRRDSIYGSNGFVSIHGVHTMPKDLREYSKDVFEIFDYNKIHQQQFGNVFGYEILD